MSSPLRPGAGLEEELDYYKKQYEQLEADLADFQASSKELEEQLERDIEAAEKNERKLKEQIEKLKYEAEEWKTKHQQSKVEANSAQNALQKEITAMRETNRSMQLKLRDIEVMNDDYERQARNTESSLEDTEGKYNVAVERGVLLEEEMRHGEQEREALRVETQRLRDELGDLKIESDITVEKLKQADNTIDRLRSRKPSPLAVESLRARSPASEASGATPLSPSASTPPPKSDTASEAPTPPSPPLSDTPANRKLEPKTPVPGKRRSLIPDPTATTRTGNLGSRTLAKHSRGPSIASSTSIATSDAKAMRPPARPRQTSRPSINGGEALPRSDSLYQIRNLRGRMQKIEERVQSARSKLPPPSKDRTPRGSPTIRSELNPNLPGSITMRRSIKRPSSNLGSLADGASEMTSDTPNRRESQLKRLSFGVPQPPSALGNGPAPVLERPGSAAASGRPSSRASRPSSRGSLVSGLANLTTADRPSSRAARPANRGSLAGGDITSLFERPSSRAARPGSRGSLVSSLANPPVERPSSRAARPSSRGSLASSLAAPLVERPSSRLGLITPIPQKTSALHGRSNSSMSGNYATIHGTGRTHRPSASISELRWKATESEEPGLGVSPARRTTLDKSAMPTPGRGPVKRQSGILAATPKRTSTGFGVKPVAEGAMRPPPSRKKVEDVGETY